MRNRPWLVAVLLVPGVLIGMWIGTGSGQGTAPARPAVPADAVQQAQTSQAVPITRPEQRKTPHDQQDPGKNAPSAAASETQPDQGQGLGFDFARDPFNAKRPMQTAEEIMQADVAEKPAVTAAQRRLLESRYDLTPRLDPREKMSRGKPLAVGPTARLASGVHLGAAGGAQPGGDPDAQALPVSGAARIPSRRPAGRSSRSCRSRCSRGSSGSTWSSISRRPSCRSSRRRSSCRADRSSATCRAARWCRSTTSTGCSRTS